MPKFRALKEEASACRGLAQLYPLPESRVHPLPDLITPPNKGSSLAGTVALEELIHETEEPRELRKMNLSSLEQPPRRHLSKRVTQEHLTRCCHRPARPTVHDHSDTELGGGHGHCASDETAWRSQTPVSGLKLFLLTNFLPDTSVSFSV